MRTPVPFLLLGLAACAAPRGAGTALPLADLAIRDVGVVDVESGALLPGRTVLIAGNRIVAVRPADEVRLPAGARVVDGAGRYLVPGLWDMHAHLNGAASDTARLLPAYLASGVTGIRDMWSDPPGLAPDSVTGLALIEETRRTRDRVRAGRLPGPRIVLASGPLDGPHGPDGYVHVVRSAEEARAVVAASAAKGVDLIGTYRWIGPEAYAAAAEAARERGLPLVGLAPVAATFAELTAAGQRTRDGYLEWEIACSTVGDSLRAARRELARRDARDPSAGAEGSMARAHLAARPRLRETFDPELCRRAAAGAARSGFWQTPRLVYGRPEASGGAHGARAAEYLHPEERGAWQSRVAQVRRDSAGTVSAAARREREIYRILHAAGIPLLVGTESYFGSPATWGFSVHDELVELVGIGLTPAQALRAATLEPARALGMADSLGTVAPGKLADLVLLDADPLQDVRNTARIAAVIHDGRLLDRAALDALLEAVRRSATATAP
ncbi:MAG TPA: amidohydrolase family protein [Longimicrobiaceae bacterium]|nr:amidohydrolase family protein [Longimicrobiaceae bacterium]